MEKNNLKVEMGKVGENDDCIIIKLSGSIITQEIPRLNDIVRPFAKNTNSIILDLNKVSSISSLGLSFIIRLHSSVKSLKIILGPENPLIYDILNHAGIMKLISIYNTQDEVLSGS